MLRSVQMFCFVLCSSSIALAASHKGVDIPEGFRKVYTFLEETVWGVEIHVLLLSQSSGKFKDKCSPGASGLGQVQLIYRSLWGKGEATKQKS